MPEQERWVEARAVAFALGRLDDPEEERFRTATAAIPQMQDLLEPGDAEPGHVPPALLARWKTARVRLGALERQLVLEHLRDCDACREEVRVLGLDGSVEPQPAPATPTATWWPWFGGALLGVAATVAVMLLRAPETPSFHGHEIQVVTPRAVRGIETVIVRLGTDAKALVLAVALPADVPSGASATLRVYDPQEQLLSETGLGPTPWSSASAQILLARPRGFAAGEYRVELQVSGEAGPRELGRYEVELVR